MMASNGAGKPAARTRPLRWASAVQDLDGDTRQQLGLKAGEGVGISDITGSVAAQAQDCSPAT